MRSIKRPLSVLLAALMLVSIMVIAPVTASAETVEVEINKWVKGQLRENSALYKFPDLFDNVIFARVTKNATPSWASVVKNGNGQDNKTDDLKLSTKGETNTYQLKYWHNDNGTMLGDWEKYNNATDGIYIDAAPIPPTGVTYHSFSHTDVDWYAYTWETFTLTKHDAVAATPKTQGNVEYYTAGERYFTKSGEGAGATYTEVEDSSTLFYDYDYNTTFTRDNEDPMKSFGSATPKKMETLGVQTSVSVENAFRFVTVVDSSIINDASDYGYIVVKAGNVSNAQDAMSKANQLDAASIDSKYKFSCKDTSNNFSGDYGDNSAETGYKYVSCIVTNVPDTPEIVLCRFYATIDGSDYHYAPYINGSTYNGCAYPFALS